MTGGKTGLQVAEERRHLDEELARDVFRSRRHLAEDRVIFIQELVIEPRVQHFLHPRFDFADVDQHAVGRVDLAGENKKGDVVSPGSVARRGLGAESGGVFLVRPAGLEKRRREAENSRRLLTVSSIGRSLAEQRQKFAPGARVVFEAAEEARRFHDRILLLHAAHHHAEMFRFDHDGHA